ncbi:anthranilate 1,2-dioxygenase regulatory protein AndR [Burkholderia cenocepacia]|uniref:anthranilate 1,2-dioxygenase regulatory protein AndR n=1 Tax=Burkholderia cenocepacia TaxID=95486 RepID=UPI0028583CE3|nr:anthranilate 1,2-dioxygenase regulatory protein AndR [Burkholderia cenocepacia]MDR8071915.1 AraC family transcriptional regulator [Burkholderia cenocepacia]
MNSSAIEPSALRAHKLFESRDLDETREHISRVMQPHALQPCEAGYGTASMSYVPLGGIGIGTITFGSAMRVQVDALDGYFLLMFCISGSAQVRAMGPDLRVDARTGILCAPGERFVALLSPGCEQFILRINEPTLRSLLCNTHADVASISQIDNIAVRAWYQQLMLAAQSAELLNLAKGSPRIADRLERLLVELLIDEYQPMSVSRTQDLVPAFVRRAQEFIESDYALPLRCSDIACSAGVSERTLRQAFLQFRRVSPMHYLRRTRLEHARELLSGHHVTSIAEIALDCGFTHLGRFSMAYRQEFGELPSKTAQR